MPVVSPEPAFGNAEAAEAKAAFHLRLRARGVRDLAVLRAFELTPRAAFFPGRYAALAARDLPLPLPCGQTSHEPWLSARAVEALGVEPGQRVLEVGSGGGYVTAVLAQLGAQVLGVERFAGLAAAAGERLRALGLQGAAVVRGDGTALATDAGRFDRILVHAAIGSVPPALGEVLEADGRIVSGWSEAPGGQMLALWAGGLEPIPICASRYAPLARGLPAMM